jgi:hypothetical protein
MTKRKNKREREREIWKISKETKEERYETKL